MNIVAFFTILFLTVLMIIIAIIIIYKFNRQQLLDKEEKNIKKEQEERHQGEEQKQLEEYRPLEEVGQTLLEGEHKGEDEERSKKEEVEERKQLEEAMRHKEEEEHKQLEEERRFPDETEQREVDEQKRLEDEQRRLVNKGNEEKTEIKQLGHGKSEFNAASEKTKQKKQEERHKPVKKLPPDKRGGRPRSTGEQEASNVTTPKQKPHTLKPELICWNNGWKWVVGIEVPDCSESIVVTQNNELLEQDNTDNTRYYLKDLNGVVKVSKTNGDQDEVIDISVKKDGRNYLIFKMRKEWKGLGRLVRRPTIGYFLIIVPQEWKRDEKTSGTAPVTPENVQVNGYKAHFFVLKQNEETTIAFIDANGVRIQLETGNCRFILIGKEISDFSEDMGPLFGEEPPLIKTIDESGWNNIGVIVVGEEGSCTNRWRTQFTPKESCKEQKLPDELKNRHGGWYFVRIYDRDDVLIESLDFRFHIGLKDIQIINSKCLPELDGYNDVTIQFIHQPNCKIELVDKGKGYYLEIRQENNLTIIVIPPNPDYDKTNWILRDEGAEISVTVLVERIWWNLGVIGEAPTNWTDKPITSTRKHFTATSDKVLWVKFPRPRFVRRINVGNDRSQSRSYQIEVDKEELDISLRDFSDVEEIEDKKKEFAMKIWVSTDETQTYEALVLKIPPESSPVEPKQQLVQHAISIEEKAKKIKAIIKCPGIYHRGKLRHGKGFSRIEIDNAGLIMEEMKRLQLPYDKRRKSSHSWNIEKLK